jgi:hypothetical protein
MAKYPIHIPRRLYGGSKKDIRRKTDKYNQMVVQIEQHLNKRIEECHGEVQVIHYCDIAEEMGLPIQTVEDILFTVDCGSNGITVYKKSAP